MEIKKKIVVYVHLLDEGVIVARPTYGEVIGDNIVRILPTENYSLDDEIWEFPPGTLVRCEKRIKPDGEEAFLAIAIHNPKDRPTEGN